MSLNKWGICNDPICSRQNEHGKYVMISTWLPIGQEKQKPSLLYRWPDHTVVIVVSSTKCINDLTTAGRAVNEVNIRCASSRDRPLASQLSTRNQHNKYLLAVCVNWQAGDWCGCRRVGWIDGTDQPDEVRKQSSRCIWPSWSPIKWGITQSRPCEQTSAWLAKTCLTHPLSFHHRPVTVKKKQHRRNVCT